MRLLWIHIDLVQKTLNGYL